MASPSSRSLMRSTQTILTESIDLSSLIECFDEFKPNESTTTDAFVVDDLKMYLRIYPKGVGKNDRVDINGVAIWLRVKGASSRDDRVIAFASWYGVDDSPSFDDTHKVCEFSSGRKGRWILFCTREDLKKHRVIHFKIRLQSTLFQPPEISIKSQHRKFYDICIEKGDVRLMVTESQDDLTDLECVAPPTKKRRRYYTRSQSTENISSINEEEGNESNVVRMSSAVLRSASPVFDRLLSTEMVEKRSKQITIHAKSVDDVKDMLYFCCTDILRNDANALNLIPLAHMYQMHRLFWKCAERVCRNVTKDTFVETVEILNKYDIEQGFPLIVDWAKDNIKELKKRDDFNLLSCAFRSIILEKL